MQAQTQEQDTALLEHNDVAESALVASLLPAGDTHMDTVRNILFGEQFRELERRQALMDRQLRVSLNQLNSDTQKRFDGMTQELLILKDQLAEEVRLRGNEQAGLRKRIEQHDQSLEDLSKRAKLQQAQINERVTNEVAQLAIQLETWRADLLQQLQQATEQLRQEKADRKAVAGLLNSMAQQLFTAEQA